MDQVWARNHVLTTLKRRHLAGEPPVGVQELQALAGIGPGDLDITLGVLVEEGKVVRFGADHQPAWALAPESADIPEYHAAEAAAETASPAEPPSPWTPAAADEARTVELAPAPAAAAGEPQEMRLNHAMVQAIHPDVLGAMIFAGCASAAEAGAEFRLVVAL
jgi:hypothetical protein